MSDCASYATGMEDGILITIKKMLGLSAEYTPFDTDIIVFINSALMTLTQANVGPKNGFRITGMIETWDEFLTNDVLLEGAKEFIYLKVRTAFDPPSSQAVLSAMNASADQLLWRLIAQSESAETFDFVEQSASTSSD